MSNTYFQFKRFRIEQDRCAMKVTTDACIQGAWTPILPNVKQVLDIGAGTGLLSLLLAQRNADLIIDAIELDTVAATQAMENISKSEWPDKINILQGDIRDYQLHNKYDLIISNPPFFNNSLLSDSNTKNDARHTLSLGYSDLLNVANKSLNGDGYLSVLLPYTEYQLFKNLLQQNDWFEFDKLYVCHRPQTASKRVVGLFAKKITTANETTLTIQENSGRYTPEFIELMAPFYLNL